jgi:hypothetical protein
MSASHTVASAPSAPDAYQDAIAPKQAIAQIKRNIKRFVTISASQCLPVQTLSRAIYSFNIHPDELEDAYGLLDKLEGRKSMRFKTILS